MRDREWWQLERIDFSLGEGTHPSDRSELAVRNALIAGIGTLFVTTLFVLYDRAHGQKPSVYWPVCWLAIWSFTGRGFTFLRTASDKIPSPDTTDPVVLRERLRHRRNAGLIQFAFALAISFFDREMGLFLPTAVAFFALVFLYRTWQIDQRIGASDLRQASGTLQ